jgi:hypothetical protein
MGDHDIIISDPDRIWDITMVRRATSKITGWRRSFYHPEYRSAEAKRVSERLLRAIELYGHRITRVGGRIAPESTCPRRASDCAYTSPYSPLYLHPLFMQALEPFAAERTLRKITIIDRAWITDLRRLEVEADDLRNRVRHALKHCHGVFAIEFAIRRGPRRMPGDWEVHFHVEGLYWGLETDRQARAVSQSFETGFSGLPSVVRKLVYDVPGAVAYMLKHPYSLYSEYPGAGDTKIRTVRDLPYRAMAKVWQRFRMTDWTDMVFAVNDGNAVLDRLMAELTASHHARWYR